MNKNNNEKKTRSQTRQGLFGLTHSTKTANQPKTRYPSFYHSIRQARKHNSVPIERSGLGNGPHKCSVNTRKSEKDNC